MPARRVEIDPGFRARPGELNAFEWPYAQLEGGERVDMRRVPSFESQTCDFCRIPLARPAQPEEIAEAVRFLASLRCTYITGHTLVVDGGLSITF